MDSIQLNLIFTNGVSCSKGKYIEAKFVKYKDLLNFLPDNLKLISNDFHYFYFYESEQKDPNEIISPDVIGEDIYIYYRNKSLKDFQFNKPLENSFIQNSIFQYDNNNPH